MLLLITITVVTKRKDIHLVNIVVANLILISNARGGLMQNAISATKWGMRQ